MYPDLTNRSTAWSHCSRNAVIVLTWLVVGSAVAQALEESAPGDSLDVAGAQSSSQEAALHREVEEEFHLRRHTERAHLIVMVQVGSPVVEVEADYPNGEVETMWRVPVVLKQRYKDRAGPTRPAPRHVYLTFTRKKLNPGSNALLFLRETPSGNYFVLKALDLRTGGVPVELETKVKEMMR